MAELDRRLRRAIRPGGGDSGEAGARKQAEGMFGADQRSNASAPARPETDTDPETAWPADAQPGGAQETGQIANGGGAGQFEPDGADKLPTVEELTRRAPPEALAALDELFRAKWTGVKRLRPGDLRS